MTRPLATAGAAAIALASMAACTPTVQLQAPDKPITINLNVKIDQEVRVLKARFKAESVTEVEVFRFK